MKALFSQLCIWAALASALMSCTSNAQDSSGKEDNGTSDSRTVTRITLGSTTGSPGDSVVVPIYLTPAEGTKIGKVKVGVQFVSLNLKFDKVEPGIAAEMSNATLDSDLKTDKNEKGLETSSLTISASIPTEEKSKEGIENGLLGYIILRISESGRPATISMKTTADAEELGTGKRIGKIQTGDASVEVIAPGSQPVVACFFFTH